MKLAIISDIHDNLANLERFLDIFKKECATLSVAQEEEDCGIICCGDVTTPETLETLVKRFSGSIKLACGNMEIRREEFERIAQKHKNLTVFPEIGEWEVDGLKLAFVHRPDKTKELALRQVQGKPLYSFIFYGHTHKPWVGQEGETLIANPGTLGGVFTAPTFAILDTETKRLGLRRLWP